MNTDLESKKEISILKDHVATGAPAVYWQSLTAKQASDRLNVDTASGLSEVESTHISSVN
ncbi:MAG TPA: hypothetical protein VKF38_16715 [Anaerolineaceae bacterium]|nr:hypothetical protein [Anaerolineaceae bacterium]